ncbi:protein disabled isoform X1 [Pieris napi]|uniref:protein disabled isoform X1 n=1 Tax=Pieris napi TaxID=78633 RepID=UPI001FBABD16|nr:protein disabled isoform X1 [Pieris napi]
MFNHKLPTDFPMQTLRKKTSPCKFFYAPLTDKNEPGRFLGEGVPFRAKLIGVLEVPEARGDKMCQEALSDLKMAIRAAGEHKQRIQVHVAIDGLRLRDDKTGDSLYHHPVHKISFIAQDMTDSRAFGYIFGSPDTGHRFFGIKTDKAASQVVIAMRDLFQVVFELKKKEIEMAKQNLEENKQTHPSSLLKQINLFENKSKNSTSESPAKAVEGAEGGVAELVDLEQELCSLRRGLSQVEGLTPSSDPFGDSFITPPQKGLLPPPPGAGRGRTTPGRSSASPSKPLSFDVPSGQSPSLGAPGPSVGLSGPSVQGLGGPVASFGSDFEQSSLVDNVPEPLVGSVAGSRPAPYDVFTELDPLGTGRSKPYVDKKLFFQELKNPPKKVLKDLVPTTSILNDILPVTEPTDSYGPTTTMTSLSRHSGGTVSIVKNNQSTGYTGFFSSDPFAETDPFDNTDPFSDTFKEDPFTSMQEFSKSSFLRAEDSKSKLSKDPLDKEIGLENRTEKNVFNGPLHVSLPPEPVPKSPRLQRQMTDTTTIRQRPQPSSKMPDNASPPPPLPPKKVLEPGLPPPRPPHEYEPDVEDLETGPPLPKPVRKKEPVADRSMKPRMSSVTTNSSEDEYLAPAPPPLPAAKRFDITLCQLLTLTMDELAIRLRVPATTLSSMTLPQLTEYLRSYLAADVERAHIHVEPSKAKEKENLTPILSNTRMPEKITPLPSLANDFKPQFEDNFAPTDSADTFVANFDDFDQKANSSYDRYAAFREIQEQELKAKSILDPKEPAKEDKELTHIQELVKTEDKSPLKSLDELTLNTFNMFRNSVSPKPVDAKIEDVKNVMMNLQLEKSRRSVSPREEKLDETDRYAALREITITEPQDDFESIPPEVPKERKKSDEKSDGFDNSDFFDCIDNSSLSFTHVEDAFRKSPAVKEREEEKIIEKSETPIDILPVSLQPPQRLSAGSISDVASGSSPDTKVLCVACAERCVGSGGLRRLAWNEGWSSDSRDSEPRRRRKTHFGQIVQTSSSSRDASPWEEERSIRHTTRRDRESRHNSSGSRECLDSGSGREKEKIRDKRESRDQRDSGSGRDRRDLSREKRDRRSRDRDDWDRDRPYRERDYRDSRSRERSKDYREMERHRKSRHSYDDDEDYSDGCGSGRSSPRKRWPEQRWRRDERHYGSLGWRETRRRHELRQAEDSNERRMPSTYTLGWPGRRSGSHRESNRDLRDSGREHSGRDSREHRESGRDSGRDSRDPRDSGRESGRDSRDPRDSGRESATSNRDSIRDSRDPRRRRREEARVRPNYRFSNDFSPREKEHSPFDNDYQESPAVIKKRAPYSSLEGTRFAFEEDTTASPMSGSSARARDGDSPAARFRFDSDSISPRSMFEDDFTLPHVPHIRPRTASIAEEEEGDIPPLRTKPPPHKDIKKSDSVNIFTREIDPFENDAFFACTGSDKVAKRENWPGDFVAFEDI